jgi:hypothetical protein
VTPEAKAEANRKRFGSIPEAPKQEKVRSARRKRQFQKASASGQKKSLAAINGQHFRPSLTET